MEPESRTAKEKAERRQWLMKEAEKLRQQCNQLTKEERRKARQRALQIVYGADAIPETRRH